MIMELVKTVILGAGILTVVIFILLLSINLSDWICYRYGVEVGDIVKFVALFLVIALIVGAVARGFL